MRGKQRHNPFFPGFGFLLLFFVMAGCTITPKPIQVKEPGSGTGAMPTRIVLFPPDISVNEISAGGVVQEDPDWSLQAEQSVKQAVQDFFVEKSKTVIVPMPGLAADEEALVHEHLLLYDVVAGHAFMATRAPALGWGHKIENFDYTIGSGLRFLKNKCGADAGLFMIGSDSISTGGRKAMVAFAALMGVGMPVGSSNLQAGIVDLETGAILWFNNVQALGNRDLRKYEDSRFIIEEIFEDLR